MFFAAGTMQACGTRAALVVVVSLECGGGQIFDLGQPVKTKATSSALLKHKNRCSWWYIEMAMRFWCGAHDAMRMDPSQQLKSHRSMKHRIKPLPAHNMNRSLGMALAAPLGEHGALAMACAWGTSLARNYRLCFPARDGASAAL